MRSLVPWLICLPRIVTKGFQSVLDKYPQLTVVQGEGNWNNTDSYNRTSGPYDQIWRSGCRYLCPYPRYHGVSGVVSAVENAGKNPADYFISGICIGKRRNRTAETR